MALVEKKAVYVAFRLLLLKQWPDLRQRAIAGCEIGGLGCRFARSGRCWGRKIGPVVDAERRETHGCVCADRVENIGGSRFTTPGFRDKQGIPGTVIALVPSGEVRRVEIGRIKIERRAR